MTKVKVVFALYGEDLDPEAISSELEMPATRSWKKGDRGHYNNNVLRAEGSWQISTDYQDSFDIQDQFKAIQGIVYRKSDPLKTLIKQNKAFVKFEIVIKVRDRIVPAMSLEPDILALAVDLGAVIDFDIYFE